MEYYWTFSDTKKRQMFKDSDGWMFPGWEQNKMFIQVVKNGEYNIRLLMAVINEN